MSKRQLIVIPVVVAACVSALYVLNEQGNRETDSPNETPPPSSNEPALPTEHAGNTSSDLMKTTEPEPNAMKQDIRASDLDFLSRDVMTEAMAATNRAEFAAKYGDPRDLIRLRWRHSIPYDIVVRLVEKEEVPLLHDMLQDRAYAPWWPRVAQMIAYVSDDPCSVPVLLDYFQRDDSWNFKTLGRMVGKIWTLALIGKLGGPQADDILRKAVTQEGAAELSSAWIADKLVSDQFWDKKENVIEYIRGCAAKGLALSGEAENIDLLKKLYSKERDYCKANRTKTKLFRYLASAMAMQEFIEEKGLVTYLDLGPDREGTVLRTYRDKYSWRPKR